MLKIVRLLQLIVIFLSISLRTEFARILAVFPIPSISHQVGFRPLTQELAKRGHEVVVLTTDPHSEGETLRNLVEIDVHDISYDIWKKILANIGLISKQSDQQWAKLLYAHTKLFEKQMNVIRRIIRENEFDLLIIEAVSRPTLGLTSQLKVPVIQISSLTGLSNNYKTIGAPVHPILYPGITRSMIYNVTIWQQFRDLYDDFKINQVYDDTEIVDNNMLNKYDENTPLLSELRNNVDMLFLNYYSILNNNLPIPLSVVYFGGSREIVFKGLPPDLQSFLDSSKHGVIYMSFGSNIRPSSLPFEVTQMFLRAFSQLPYDILMKWDKDELPNSSKNIKIAKWFPQIDVLGHHNLKLFITQAGLQSTYEAIATGVPIICVPLVIDQWHNAEKNVYFGIGEKLYMKTLTESSIVNTVKKIITNGRYRENVIKLRFLLQDQPQRPLERALWWTEYVLRHGARHLRAPAANMPWTEYFEVELMIILLGFALFVTILVYALFYILIKILKYYLYRVIFLSF